MKAKETEEKAYDHDEALRQRFTNLTDAVRKLYYCAHWTPDRAITRTEFNADECTSKVVVEDPGEIWTAVRDAAGFPKGGSPKEQPFPGIRVAYTIERLRLLGRLLRKEKGGEFTSAQAEAFLLLHREELGERLALTVREFMKEKLA
jgi:hypothetical protein